MNIFYLNGQFVPEDEAKISVLDLGFVRGYGVFDFLRTYNGQPFKLDRHLDRLLFSCRQINLEIPWTKDELKKLSLETLAKNKIKEANVKIIISGGISPNQLLPAGKPTLAILVYPATIYPESFYKLGVKLITIPAGRIFPTAKTTDYLLAVKGLIKAKKEKAVEALYLNDKNEVLEATTSNFFAFEGETLITAKEGILSGITREVVLNLAAKEFKISLRPIKYNEIGKIDEAFITATNKEVMPVVKIDDLTVGNGKVGEKTKRLMELFKKQPSRFRVLEAWPLSLKRPGLVKLRANL